MGGRDDEEPDGPHEEESEGPATAPAEPFGPTAAFASGLAFDLRDDTDEGDEDEPFVGPVVGPLPPDDRLWRHPSEISSAGLPDAASVAARPRTLRRRAAGSAPKLPAESRLALVLAVVVGALLTAGVLAATGRLTRVEVAAPASAPTSIAVAVRSTQPGDAAALVARVQPGVLAVQASRPGMPNMRGSALVVRPGHAITALRVVDGAAAVLVHVQGHALQARVVGSDPETDLALLAFDGATVEPPLCGMSSDLRPGDTAVSLTAPPADASGPSVTVGVISAVDRTTVAGKTVLRGILQIDRPIPPEGAGGALLDATGNVVGVTLPATDASSPVGYAIPIDAVNEVSKQLLASGRVSRPWLGIEGGDDAHAGAAVWQVRPSSPAARAGIQVGDVVTALDGAPINTMDAMLRVLRTHRPGDTVKLTILRNGASSELMVTLAAK